ncbi:MAG TPA: DUF3667 domain-containing protein [Flavipsychrobacter sp.]|nr:DUF3667 domain-containing protein [Flavipsychrobacter sp.]
MADHTCLNCGQRVEMNYCGRCGQSIKTHRFSLKHIFSHDLIHGIFHFDKGFFFTATRLLSRPGHSVRSYIQGKRVKHFNYVTFIILLIAIYHLLISASGFKIAKMIPTDEKTGDLVNGLQKLWLDNYKILALVTIPVYSLFTFLLFRRSRKNYAEHLVLNAYRQGGELLLNILITAIIIPFKNVPWNQYLVMSLSLIMPLYTVIFYMQFFSPEYKSRFGVFQRATLVHVLVALVLMLIAYFLLPGLLKEALPELK